MKKFFMLAVVAVAALSASAQYSPEKGDFSVEVQFNPFSNNYTTFQLDDPYKLTGKYYICDKHAIRVGLGIGYDYNNSEGTEESKTGKERVDYTLKNKTTSFSISAGYEYHFFNYGRLDVYAGGELGISTVSCSGDANVNGIDANGEVFTVSYNVKKAHVKANGYTPDVDGTETSSFNFGVAAFLGANFYVYKGLYVGTEVGLKFKTGSGDKYDIDGSYVLAGKEVQNYKYEGNGSTTTSAIKFYVVPALRLGWTF